MKNYFFSSCFDRVKLRKSSQFKTGFSQRFKMCVCYVNHLGETILKGLIGMTNLSLLSASGVSPVEQHPVEDSSSVPQEKLTTLGGKVTKLSFPHPSSPWAPISSFSLRSIRLSMHPSIHPYVRPSLKPMSGCLLWVCVIVAWQAHATALAAGARANLIFNSTRLLD